MSLFKLHSEYKPAGDQIPAIKALEKNLKEGAPAQVLQGVTGSGKTFTLANVIAQSDRPVLVLSHNKTLAAQLYSEFKAFFPENAVEYFISYYDYYLPESYIPQTDTYIAKDASINKNIERLRLSATTSLVSRRDVLVVASVSCIYGLGSPEEFEGMCIELKVGDSYSRKDFLERLIAIQYNRNDVAPEKGLFRVRGDSVDVFPADREDFLRISFWGEEIESLTRRDIVTGRVTEQLDSTFIFPTRLFVMPQEQIESAIPAIMDEMRGRVRELEQANRLVEAQRLFQRVKYDMEMMKEIGYCPGIENYSRHLSKRPPGSRPFCLLDFLKKDFLTIVDESHVTIPQIRAMFNADRNRKNTLVEHGFRLPSALDNRPLKFDEFNMIVGDTIFVSATPADYELDLAKGRVVKQVVRPTGLLDPEVEVRPLETQVDDVMEEIRKRSIRGERSLVTTLTKKSAERLSDYLCELGLRVKYIHSEIDAIARVKILSELRKGEFDCLVGINLLREGIDLPEVALVAILDADKEGFLRSERSLIQVAGRAARNANGKVILYADVMTDSIKGLIRETEERRAIQMAYNKEHNIVPKTIVKAQRETIDQVLFGKDSEESPEKGGKKGSSKFRELNAEEIITELEKEMLDAASALEFERAAMLRDRIKELKEHGLEAMEPKKKRAGRKTPS